MRHGHVLGQAPRPNLYRFYDATLNEAALKRLTMESQLRKAIERNEFTLHYQPQLIC